MQPRRRESAAKGLDPDQMVVPLHHAHVGLPRLFPVRPQIPSAFLHRRLDFRLDQFESYGQNFTFSFTHHDISRCEVILAIYINFFRDRIELFANNEVEITFFLESFKQSEVYGEFRHILQLQHNVLFDPVIFLLSVLGQCDDRFLQFFGGLDFAIALANAIANFELKDARVLRNAVHLFIDLFQYHNLFDDTFEDFREVYTELFQVLDANSMPPFLKTEILFLFVAQAPPLPELYPALFPIFTESLSVDSFPYFAASLSHVVRKCPDFAFAIPKLGLLALLSKAYAAFDATPAGNCAYLGLLVALMAARDSDFAAAVLKPFDWARVPLCLVSADASVATAALDFVDRTAPASLARVAAAFGQFWQLLDAVCVSLARPRPEQALAALRVLRRLGQHCPREMAQFTNQDFTRTVAALLGSGVAPAQEGALAFFDAYLNTGEVPLAKLGNWCLEFEDGGGRTALLALARGRAGALAEHADAVIARIEDIERAHRNRS
jgi:hypothetical protein